MFPSFAEAIHIEYVYIYMNIIYIYIYTCVIYIDEYVYIYIYTCIYVYELFICIYVTSMFLLCAQTREHLGSYALFNQRL